MGYCLWEPKRVKNVEQECQRLTKAQGKTRPMKTLKVKSKRKHLVCDYSHMLPRLHCPWDEEAKKETKQSSPTNIFHGLHSTDVTERLNPRPPNHAAHPSLADAPAEYHGRQAQDVTEMFTFASRGKRPPSRDHYYGREATDISEFLRIIPPVAKEGDESNEFFGRPKSDVTDYNLFPVRTIDTKSRSEEARPLGRCPPGPMCDYVPLVRDKDGKLTRPEPVRPPSPLCDSGTHELPVSTLSTGARRHQPESQQEFVPGAGGILAQVVPGFSRSEAKKPVGRGVPGVMADYVPLKRDESGKVVPTELPPSQPWHSSQAQSRQAENEASNRYDKKHPLGKVPIGVMNDFAQNPPRGKHKHTTDGYWAIPTEYPRSPTYCPDTLSKKDDVQWSPGPTTPSEAAVVNTADTLRRVKTKLKKDRRRNAVCEMHEPGCPLAAEQGHVGPCISHPAIASYVKWPKDGELERGPCQKHGGRTGIFSVKGSPCSNARSTSPTLVDRLERPLSGSVSIGGPHSPGHSRTNSGPNQSPLRPDTACPRAACQCIRLANKGTGPPIHGYADSISRLDPKYPKKPSSVGSKSSSAASGMADANRSANRKLRKKSMSFVTEETNPQHFQIPYFGLAQTDVTNPALSTKRAHLGRTQHVPGQENEMPFGSARIGAEKASGKSCNQADVCRHHHDRKLKTPWFGRSKTSITDPAVSPNLTPPSFKAFR